MHQLTGMDPGAVDALAGKLSSQADALSGTVAGVDRLVHLVGGQWRGQAATDFLESWQRTHRPALVAAQRAVAGLAESARHNARQQVETSSTAGGSGGGGATAGGGGGCGPGAGGQLRREVQEAQSLSKRYGWVAAPAVGMIPGVAQLLSADSGARTGQDLGEHHYMAAFEEGSSQASSRLLSLAAETKNPELALAAVDVTLWSDVVVTASHDHLRTFTTWTGVYDSLRTGGLPAAEQILSGTFSTVAHQLGGMGWSFVNEAWGAVGGLLE